MKYLYEFTKNAGESLMDSLRDSDYQDLLDREYDYFVESAQVGGDNRSVFVTNQLLDSVLDNDEDWIIDEIPAYSSRNEKDLEEWLQNNKCPEVLCDEDEEISKWANNEAYHIVDDSDCIPGKDDVSIAFNFGFIKYPPYENDRYIPGDNKSIPSYTANAISRLMTAASKSSDEHRSQMLSNLATRLEQRAARRMILIKGASCDHCGNMVEYNKAIQQDDIPRCLDCGAIICPSCFSDYGKNDESDAYDLFADLPEQLKCTNCGHSNYELGVMYMKLIDRPLPDAFATKAAFELYHKLKATV